MDQYVLIDYLKKMPGVKSVSIEGICTRTACVVTESPAIADLVNMKLVLMEREGRVSDLVVFFDLD